MLIWVQEIWHEVLREVPTGVEEVLAEVQEKYMLVVGVGAEVIIDRPIDATDRVIG